MLQADLRRALALICTALVALLAGNPRFGGREFVGMAALVCGTAAKTGDLALTLRRHRRKTALGPLWGALVLPCHFILLKNFQKTAGARSLPNGNGFDQRQHAGRATVLPLAGKPSRHGKNCCKSSSHECFEIAHDMSLRLPEHVTRPLRSTSFGARQYRDWLMTRFSLSGRLPSRHAHTLFPATNS